MEKLKFSYERGEYKPDELLRLIDAKDVSEETKNWAKRELQLNGYLDYSDYDAGEPNKGDVKG